MAALILATSLPLPAAEPCFIVDNFSAEWPSSASIKSTTDLSEKKAGLASGRFAYKIDRPQGRAELVLQPPLYRIQAPGTLKLWVKGDKSGNGLKLHLWHGKRVTDPQGNTRYEEGADVWLPVVKLDFDEWRELTFDAKALPKDRQSFVRGFSIEDPSQKEPQLQGAIWIDDMTLAPSEGPRPMAAVAANLVGSRFKVMETNIAVAVDVRNFSDKPVKARARLSLADFNDTPMADRDTEIALGPGESKEVAIPVNPSVFAAFLPPFRLRGDVLSPDLQDLSARIEETITFGNSYLLFEPFADVRGGWATCGGSESTVWGGITAFTVSEAYRYVGLPDNDIRLRRVDIPPSAGGETNPPGRFALRVDFDRSGPVFNMREPARRYLPGDAFRLGLWIKGDGSGARVEVIVHDFSDMADFWYGGWKRVSDDRPLCTLDFTGWRYLEIDLPGGGIGTHLPKGSTDGVDFPLELAGFYIDARDPTGKRDEKGNLPFKKGAVEFGPVFAWTQQRTAEALTAFAAYDDPEHLWNGSLGAWAIVQNGWPWTGRKFNVTWNLLNRNGDAIAAGKAAAELKAQETQAIRIDLAPQAVAIQKAAGPLRLQVIAMDAADSALSADREIILAKPDSRATLTGFEQDRGYMAFAAAAIPSAKQPDEPVARTTDQLAHSGTRSLAIQWNVKESRVKLVSIDPPLPGIPVTLSLWVCGDGSGVQFYPLIGDKSGVNKGVSKGQWDLFTVHTLDNPPQEVVTVDWTGWKELKFRLPVIPPSWNTDLPVLSFVPSYPLGLHLVVLPDAQTNKTEATLYVDDITVETHLPPEERVGMMLDLPGESDTIPPNGELGAWVWNSDLGGPRNLKVTGGVWDWRGQRVAGEEAAVSLNPAERKRVVIARNVPAGAFSAKAELKEGDAARSAAEADLLVTDLKPLLGDPWQAALTDSWKLRGLIESRFEVVDEDWDWVEYFPGNFQTETVSGRLKMARDKGADPFLLLGYSAYWAAGAGLAEYKAHAFNRRPRDAGHAVDTFMIPERLADWDNYIGEVMRSAGNEVSGWVLWDNPDAASGPLSMKPEKLLTFMETADRWRRLYCPDKPLLIGGMQKDTAPAYLDALAKTNALDLFTGIHMRLDLGRLAPEDALIDRIVHELKTAMRITKENPKSILFTDLDWAVEKDPAGITVFDQSAYLARATLLLDRSGFRPTVTVANGDFDRLGLGVAYRRTCQCPPATYRPRTLLIKPAWLGLANIVQWRHQMEPVADVEVQDVQPGSTWCLLYKRSDGAPLAVVWRNDAQGLLSFAQTGYEVVSADDIFGTPVTALTNQFPIGKVPVRFVLKPSEEAPAEALARLRVCDLAADPAWPQMTLAAFTPASGTRFAYQQTGGESTTFEGQTPYGDAARRSGMKFTPGGSESFEVPVPAGDGLVLRKGYFLDDAGQQADVLINGQPAGAWNLLHAEKELSGGLRDAAFVVDRKALAGADKATVELRYPRGGNTIRWVVLDYRGGAFPLPAVGPIHANQGVGAPRPGRNIVGSALKIGDRSFSNGFGCFALSLQEYALSKQFKKFTVEVGVDAATEGKGSVMFEIYGDGKKLWASPVMSGLDAAKAVDLPVDGVDRLRLVVTDAGDGNRYDAADWCNAALHLQ